MLARGRQMCLCASKRLIVLQRLHHQAINVS
jgi:hypothetical protein